MTAQLFDDRTCSLGEGPLWHPERQQLFWFDINNKKMLSLKDGKQLEWSFDRFVSAAGWINTDTLLIASETNLFEFNLNSGESLHVCDLEADNPLTRSNDGRADPWGGFWIGTMGKNAEENAGSIYRYFQGKLIKLFGGITISNSICFSPDRQNAYYTDTATRKIMRQPLGSEGWPVGSSELFVDLSKDDLNPDGAEVDAEGCLWSAQWGASRIARYSPDGVFLSAVEFPAKQISCPAFGGQNMTTLFATSATQNMGEPSIEQGRTYCASVMVKGQPEHHILL